MQLVSACKVGRSIIYNFADIDDYEKFENRAIQKPLKSFNFNTTENGVFPKKVTKADSIDIPFDQFLAENKTVAFLIIKDDTIQYEKYFNDYQQESITTSFSMAKSVISILIGCAIDDGYIKNTQQLVGYYVPEIRHKGFNDVTIEHLLQMTSGIKFNESYYNPFGDAATFYYGTNLRKAVAKMKLDNTPGTSFDYTSGSTQLLGLILERALITKTISQYLEEKLWKPLGMEYDASWSLDRETNGLEKTFCCINARARDFAKIGRLYLNNGDWNGKQIVSKKWVKQSLKNDTTNGSVSYYQYQWWLSQKNNDFMAKGILGQYIYVNPAKNLIIVRMGENYGKTSWEGLFRGISNMYP